MTAAGRWPSKRASEAPAAITESPRDIDLGGTVIPASRSGFQADVHPIPRGRSGNLDGGYSQDTNAAERLRGKAVFIGATARQSPAIV